MRDLVVSQAAMHREVPHAVRAHVAERHRSPGVSVERHRCIVSQTALLDTGYRGPARRRPGLHTRKGRRRLQLARTAIHQTGVSSRNIEAALLHYRKHKVALI